MTAVALTGEATMHILFICISNRLAATTADSQYGKVASASVSARLNGGACCRAETDWQKRTKRSDFVLTVRLSVVQGLALRLGLSNDIPNELNFERL